MPYLDSIDFYIVNQDEIHLKELSISTGWYYPYNSRGTIKSSGFTFPLNIVSYEKNTYYLRVKSSNPVLFPISIVSKSEAIERSQNNHIWYGIYFGIMLVVFLYNFVVFLMLRDVNYFYYIFSIVFTFLVFASVSGYLFKYFYSETPEINTYIVRASMVGVIFSTGIFAISFLELKKNSHRFYLFLLGIFIAAPIGFLLDIMVTNDSVNNITKVHAFSLLVVGIYSWRQGNKFAFFYSIAWAGYLLGGLLITLRNSGALPVNFWTTHGAEIGSAMEVVILSVALADRYRIIQKEKEYITKRALMLEQTNSLELEEKIRNRTLKLNESNEELAHKNKEIEKVNKFKSRFFDNISHEFRTPLTVILGSLEQQLRTVKGQEKILAEVSQRNAEVLLELINQLLALSKIESGKLSLDSKQYDLVSVLQYFYDGFETLAEQKDINFQLVKHSERLHFAFDKAKLKIILSNLLSNAIKFTPQGGTVKLILQKTDNEAQQNYVIIKVEDTGTGISPENLSHIFERFYQADNSSTRAYQGTGIGLALAKELVELHQGEISVKSKLGKGSVFTVKLPLVQSEKIGEKAIIATPIIIPVITNPTPSKVHPQSTGLPRLLIVEDNPDMSWYIHSLLSASYFVNIAKDGVEGIKKAQEWMPDLIISDVMMPNMSGTEMCQKLKSDEQTSHIPIILLTARASQQYINEGLSLGADEYLTKPFNREELLLRIQNILLYKKKLQQIFHREINIDSSAITATSADEIFLNRAIQIVEENMGDSNFKAGNLVEAIGISRSLLYKKLTALTNVSTSEFIRTLRLKKAAKLIKEDAGNLSEICYKVGFASPSYFSRSFTKHFGISPTEYQQSI